MPCACCAAESLDIFSEKAARRDLRRYLKQGLGGDAKLIAAWAEEAGLEGATVADVGGGVGQIQAELLRRGALAGRVIEVVEGYEGPARELADAVHVADRSSFELVDLLESPDAMEPADVVVLRRVVCCSPDGPELLARAAGKTRRALLASYPRERASVRLAIAASNLALRLLRKRFRAYVHPARELEQAAARAGLEQTRVSRGLVWETAEFTP